MTRRALVAAGAIVLALGALVVALIVRRADSGPTAFAPRDAAAGTREALRGRLLALRQQPPGRITGTVTAAGAPLASATVCARGSDTGPEQCVAAAADGTYQLDALEPGAYALWASAPGHGGGDGRAIVTSGQTTANIALVLVRDAIAVRGMVRDLRGKPIAGATVAVGVSQETPTYSTLTRADGRYEVWTRPGGVVVWATADGYVEDLIQVEAPNDDVDLALTPEAIVAGLVRDAASKRPLADAEVSIGGRHARTDASGAFRIDKLPPERYQPSATTIGGYGQAAESVLVTLGAHIEGVVIEIHPVAVVAGRIVVADGGAHAGCPPDDGELWISSGSSWYRTRTLDDGVVVLEGVVPGTYFVSIWCNHFRNASSYPMLVVNDSDVEDVIWEVRPGAAAIGRVTDRTTGAPIAEAQVLVRAGGDTAWVNGRTAADGTYRIDGFAPGAIAINVSALGYEHHDEVPGIARLGEPVRVDLQLVPDHTVVPDEPEPPALGMLDGQVTSPDGKPLGAVFVELELEDHDDGWSPDGPAIVTDGTGTFHVSGLREGHYAVRAFQHGGAETIMHGVMPHSRVQLVLEPTGAIFGTVVSPDGSPVTDATVRIDGEGMQTVREERLFHTQGRFALRDLPAGTYRLAANSGRQLRITLGANETQTNVRLVAEGRYSVQGRLVAADGKTPLAGWRIELAYVVDVRARESGSKVTVSDVATTVTESDGRFIVRGIPATAATLSVADVTTQVDASAREVRAMTIPIGGLDLGTVELPAGQSEPEPESD